ncbi:MAG: hypothetical protein IPH44_22325 [Myxococcales bacterium]|nr:hypothetical protein [Myxococcales bacterium]MBK7192099.1 hypothetical protein [Myxococcales bacterium]MBP6845114.1 hypothetical protein [Kofleriaceae bacterium]
MDDARGPAALAALIERAQPPPLPRARPAPARRLVKLAYLDGDDRGGALGLVWLALLLAGAVLGPAWVMRGPGWLGAATCVAVAIAVMTFSRRGQAIARDREARLAGALGATAFPCDGLIDWLTADRPLADLHLRGAVEPALVDAAIRTIDADATTRWLSPTAVRVALAPRLLRAARGRAPALYGGDLARLRAVIDQVIAPLVATPGVARLELGGEVDADASGPA